MITNRPALGALGALLLAGCAESVYRTTPEPLADTDYVFIAPYFAEVQTKIVVSIAQGAPSKDGSTPAGPPILTIGVLPVPKSRAYLYMSKNALYNNSVNVSVGSDGLLSNLDSSSIQQVTAILTELAQTAAPFVGAPERVAPPPNPDQICLQGIRNLIANLPYYKVIPDIGQKSNSFPLTGVADGKGNTASLSLNLDIPQVVSTGPATVGSEGHVGLMAFYPVPASASINCVASGTSVPLTPPLNVSLYLESHFVDPKRAFLNAPQDTFTFNEGFITGHKYSDQSSVKTLVDTVTAPVRAIIPSVSVTTQVQVQTGGGKPDQTTNTTTTAVGPSKGP
jgi:hypothetical protein